MMSLPFESTIVAQPSFPVVKSRIFVFGFLLTLLIPSILCSIYLFYQFIRRSDIRHRETNLIIICLVILNFLQAIGELPLSLIHLYLNHAAVLSPLFCQFWCFISGSFYGIGLWMMAVGSIERYLFIFHLATLKKYKISLHYFPVGCCFVLPICFYIFLVFLFPCTNHFYYGIFWCGAPCFMSIPFWQVLSWILVYGIPMFIIVISNIILTVKVLLHKHRMKQRNLWSKNARMFFQLISVALLYFICWTPFLVSGQVNAYTFNQIPLAVLLFLEYFCYLPYLTVTLCPFVCLLGLWRELYGERRFIDVILHCQQIRVVPLVTTQQRTTTRMNNPVNNVDSHIE